MRTSGHAGRTAPACHARRSDAGLTLLEVTISVVLLSLVLLGAGGLMSGVAHGTRHAQGNTTAAEALQSKIEELRSLPFDHPNLAPGDHEVQSGPFARRLRWTVVEDVPDELKRAEFNVTWTEGRRTRSLGMRVHYANRSLD